MGAGPSLGGVQTMEEKKGGGGGGGGGEGVFAGISLNWKKRAVRLLCYPG